MTPESIEPIMVTQTTVTRTIAVVFFPGACNCSTSAALSGTLSDCPSAAWDNVRSSLGWILGGCVIVAGVGVSGWFSSSSEVAVLDMVNDSNVAQR